MPDPTGAPLLPEPAAPPSGGPACTRRGLLVAALAGAAGLAAGAPLGYKFRRQIRNLRAALSPADDEPRGSRSEDAYEDFARQAREIHERHRRQTAETVAGLKKKYEHPVFGKVMVWDLIEKLAQCVDTSDPTLCGASQYLHVQQALAAMEQQGIDDPQLFLIALIHDLGKVFLLAGEVPENVLCTTGRIGEYDPGVGLDNVVYQFGHGELIYSRVKDHVPEPIAWTVRYHNVNISDATVFMDDRDRTYADRYLKPFHLFDEKSKSQSWVPALDMARFRDLVHQYFPQPILF